MRVCGFVREVGRQTFATVGGYVADAACEMFVDRYRLYLCPGGTPSVAPEARSPSVQSTWRAGFKRTNLPT
ncbi:hypothetical protein GCM10010123_25090 [Pilimelia anulata]|uniref:Uncharacterized protein n=1 Tax=Pilimelia anulata TaxID=53371 RepID=A0A8J3B742_9ACTN|nr:hypothetical protein GCM10010123_25090 [Pilimelia anulata]